MEYREYIYRTKFNLMGPVNDIEAARKFLEESNYYLLRILIRDISRKVGEDVSKKLVSITWHLEDEDSGYIEVMSTAELDGKILGAISPWIKGQCADGCGETFEQQDFASYNLLGDAPIFDNEEEEMEYEESWVMASFDWKTNDYELELVEVK